MKIARVCFLTMAIYAVRTSPATAELVLHGTTEGGSNLTRPSTSGGINYPDSAIYPAAYASYAVNPFYTDTDGHFHIASYASSGVGFQGVWNNFLILYANSFNPAKPLENAVFFNDDIYINGIRAAGNPSTFVATAFTQYFAVTTGRTYTDSGIYTLHLAGRGNSVAGLLPLPSVPSIPEPATWTMILCGFGLTGYAARLGRRQAKAIGHA